MHLLLQEALITEADSLMFPTKCNVQYTSDFKIVRPAENEQGESSGSLRSTQAGRRLELNWKESFPWIEYNTSRDVITCEACSWAIVPARWCSGKSVRFAVGRLGVHFPC